MTVGAVTLTRDGRRLIVSGLPEPSRWVVGRGPGLSVEPFAPALDAVEARQAHGVIVLGALGRGERLAEAIDALASLEVPVLIVPGPRDRPDELADALEERAAANVVSLAGIHLIELGAVQLGIAAGGASPRYVLDGACGVTAGDLEEILAAMDGDRVRALVGFDAPSGTPLTVGLDGAEAGSDAVRDAMTGAGVRAGIFAGPDTRVGEPFDGDAPGTGPTSALRWIVPPLAGPAVEGADGRRSAAGPSVLELGPAGLRAVP